MLPDDLQVADRVEDVAFEHGLLVGSTHSNADGLTGDEILLAPAFTSSDQELGLMVDRLAATLADVEDWVSSRLVRA